MEDLGIGKDEMKKEEAMAEALIRRRIEDYAKAVSARDIDGAMALFAPELVSFDLEPPLRYAGAGNKRRRWEEGFAAYSDDNLALAVDCLDRDVVENVSEEHRLLMLDAATAEVLRRLGCGCRRAA